ncbi:MAG: 4Fe-4S binding protein [Lachnospiraceae bacterium]|nr:4Fe-4S binding protein [Lachnospiraceae bacterium]
MPYKVKYDQTKCISCGTCMIACIDQCDVDVDTCPLHRRVYTFDEAADGSEKIYYVSVGCLHCHEAACIDVCPKKCIYRDEELGLVRIDRNECIGCKLCAKACPLGAIAFTEDGKAIKCDGCAERLKLGLAPACEKACQNRAITYEYTDRAEEAGGDMEDVKRLAGILKRFDKSGE